jgi:hypothetical protein
MRKVAADALVGASRDEVWDLYDDIDGRPRWVPGVREIRYLSGPARVGTVYRERRRTAGISSTAQWEITEHRRPVRQVHVGVSGAMERTRIITLEARGSGTWVHQVMELRSLLPAPLGWVHELLAVVPAGWEVNGTATGAKRVFEGHPGR